MEIIKRKCKGCEVIMDLDRQHLGKLYHSNSCKRVFTSVRNKKMRDAWYLRNRKLKGKPYKYSVSK
jgi:hypothetical protein